MADIVNKATRSRMMSGIQGKNTKPELKLRSDLHRSGFRFRLHGKLPGKPDLVFSGFNAVIFVNGCFWHGHDCHLFKWPGSRTKFWHKKILGNKARDFSNLELLNQAGWKVLVVWECAMKGRSRLEEGEVARRAGKWLKAGKGNLVIRGDENGL